MSTRSLADDPGNSVGPVDSVTKWSGHPAFEWLDAVWTGTWCYYFSASVILIGFWFSIGVVPGSYPTPNQPDSLAAACMRFDARHYQQIANSGYQYAPNARSTVAFFPLYPLCARLVARTFGIGTGEALLAVSNFCLVATFVLLARYVSVRLPSSAAGGAWIVWVFAVWPSTLFLRMPYSESLFALLSVLLLYGITRKWPLLVLSVVAGLLTAARPVGMAATFALACHVLLHGPGSRAARAARVLIYCPVACWGLLAYMAYQGMAFGDPLAFARTQAHWTYGSPEGIIDPGAKAIALLTLEPVIGVYDPESKRYWGHTAGPGGPVFSLAFWNPILFGLAVILVAFGAATRWITAPEWVFGAVALAVPYFMRAYEMSMASHARFAAVVVPAHMVAGRVLMTLPPAVSGAATGVLAVVLAFWTALFAAGYSFF